MKRNESEDGEIVETQSVTDLRDSIKGKSPTNFSKNPQSFQENIPQFLLPYDRERDRERSNEYMDQSSERMNVSRPGLEQPSPYLNNSLNNRNNVLPGSRGHEWDRDIRGEREWIDPRGGPPNHISNRPSLKPHQGGQGNLTDIERLDRNRLRERDVRDRDWDFNNRNRNVSGGDRNDWDRYPPIRNNIDMDRDNRELHFRDRDRDNGISRTGNNIGNILSRDRNNNLIPNRSDMDRDRSIPPPMFPYDRDRDIRDQRDNRGNFGPPLGFDSRIGGGGQFQQHGPPNSFDSRGGPSFRGNSNAPPPRDQWDRDRDLDRDLRERDIPLQRIDGRDNRDLLVRDIRDQRDRERLDQHDRNFDDRGKIPSLNNNVPVPLIRRQFSDGEGFDRDRFISSTSPMRGDIREFRDNNKLTSRELPMRDIPRDMRDLPIRDHSSKDNIPLRDNIHSRDFFNQTELTSRDEQPKIINNISSDNSSTNNPIVPLIKIVSSQDKSKESASVFENIANKTFAAVPSSASNRSTSNIGGGFSISLVQPDTFSSTIDLSPSVDTMDRILGAVGGLASPIRSESVDGSNGGTSSARRPRAAWGSGITPRSTSWGKGISKPVVKIEPSIEERPLPVIEEIEVKVEVEEKIPDVKEEKNIKIEEESEFFLKETKSINTSLKSPRSPKVISNKSINEDKHILSKKTKIELVVDSDAELDDDSDDNITIEKPKTLLSPKSSSKSPRGEKDSKSPRGMKSSKELKEIERQEREDKSKFEKEEKERKRKNSELNNKKINNEKEKEEDINDDDDGHDDDGHDDDGHDDDNNNNNNDGDDEEEEEEDVDDEKFIKQNLDNSPRNNSKDNSFKKDDDENKKRNRNNRQVKKESSSTMEVENSQSLYLEENPENEIKSSVTKSPRGGYRGGSNKGKNGNVNNIATSDKNINNNSLSTPLPLRTPKREYNKAIKISKNSDIIKVREKPRVVLSRVFNSDSDLLLAFNTVRVMVEMRQGAMLGQPVQLSNIVFNDSLPDGVGSVPFPLMSDITSTLELVEKHSNYLYEAMMDVNRKQYILENIENFKEAELLQFEFNDVILEKSKEVIDSNNNQVIDNDMNLEIKNNETIVMETATVEVNTIENSSVFFNSSIQTTSVFDEVNITDIQKDNKDTSLDLKKDLISKDIDKSNKTDSFKKNGESVSFIKGASLETLRSIQLQNKLRIIEAHIFTSLLNGSCENFPNSKAASKYDPINQSKNKSHKIKQKIIDVVNNNMKGGNDTNSLFNTLLDESPRVLETKEKMAKIRHHVTAEARIRKLRRRKAWEELANRHHWAQQRWIAHIEDIEQEEADKEDKQSPRLRSFNDNSSINSNSSGRISRNTSSSFGTLGGGDIIRSDYDQDRLLAQLIAKEAMAARIKKGTAPTVNMISPWYKFDSLTSPKPPVWPNELRDFKNSKGEILDNKYPSNKPYPSPVFGSIDFIDLTCSRLTTDGARQICSYLSLDNPCPPNCNCARIVDKNSRYEKLWTDMEKSIFVDKFLQYPKNFCKIASYLVNRGTKDCIKFYYDTKAAIPYKALLREFDNRRRHIRYQWVQSTTAALSVGSRIYPIGEKDGSHEPLVELPIDDGTFHTYLNHPPFQPLALNIDPKQSKSRKFKLDIDNPREVTIIQAERRIYNRKNLYENNSKMKDNFNEIPDSIEDYLVDSCVKPILNHITAPLQSSNGFILSPTSFNHSISFSSSNTPSAMSTVKKDKMNSSFHNNYHQDSEMKKSNSSIKIDKNKDIQLVNGDVKTSINKTKQVRKRRVSTDKIVTDKNLKSLNLSLDSNGIDNNINNLKADSIGSNATNTTFIVSDSNINNKVSNSNDINNVDEIANKMEELIEENEIEDLEELDSNNTEININNVIKKDEKDVSDVTEEVNATYVSILKDDDKVINIDTINENLIESQVSSSIDNNDVQDSIREITSIEYVVSGNETTTDNINNNDNEMITDSNVNNCENVLIVDKVIEDKVTTITTKRSFDEIILTAIAMDSVSNNKFNNSECEEVVEINSVDLQKNLLELPLEKKAKIETIPKEEEITEI